MCAIVHKAAQRCPLVSHQDITIKSDDLNSVQVRLQGELYSCRSRSVGTGGGAGETRGGAGETRGGAGGTRGGAGEYGLEEEQGRIEEEQEIRD